MQSLRDKLLKAGLVTEDAAKKAESEKTAKPARPVSEARSNASSTSPERTPEKSRNSRPPPRRDERVEPRLPKLPPMQGSKEAHRQAARKQVELDKQLRELVYANAVPVEVGATPFYFVTRKNKLRRLEMTAEQAKRLELGELAVVERPDPDKIEHALVTPAIAEQMLKLSTRAVRFLNKDGAKVGFLTDEEIHQRAAEANAPAEPEANEAAESQAETFITIKRAPLAG